MRRILITLILSVLIFVATLVTTDMYVSRKSMQVASNLNEMMLDNFRSEIDGNVSMTEQSVRCFLSGQRFQSVSDSGTIVLNEQHLKGFKKGIADNLQQFMKVNRYYETAMFIIDADICSRYYHHSGCYAPSVEQGDTTLRILSDHYDFMQSAHYQMLKQERRKMWSVPTAASPVAGQRMTLYMPILLSDGRFFGAFAVSLDIRMINDKLKKHLPYGEENSAIFITDEQNRIFAAYPEWVMNYREAYENALNRPARDQHADGSLRFVDEGEEYIGFSRPTNNVPWTICTICRVDNIYEEADSLKRIIYATSFLGILLMLLCSIIISRQIGKDLRKKAAVEEELRMAAHVQMALLKPASFTLAPSLQGLSPSAPSECSPFPGWDKGGGGTGLSLRAFMQPAKQAGGDLYDYAQQGDKLIFCIGDVSGKGMSAALFMTQVVSLFRNAIRSTDNPAEIASRINDVLASGNQDMTFCTFFVGVWSDRALTYCNAGHNPPLLLSKASAPRFLNVRPNIALGLMEGFPYQAETMPLAPDQSLLLYTDGVTEAKNAAHKEYGSDRLLSAVASSSSLSSDLISSVLHDVQTFVDHYEQSDDITMLHIG